MSIGGIIVTIVLMALVGAWIFSPFLRRSKFKLNDATLLKQRERILVYYERALTNLRDLDEDNATGKIDHDDYLTERDAWVQRGIRLLKMLDELEQQHGLIETVMPEEAEIDAVIEQRILAYKQEG